MALALSLFLHFSAAAFWQLLGGLILEMNVRRLTSCWTTGLSAHISRFRRTRRVFHLLRYRFNVKIMRSHLELARGGGLALQRPDSWFTQWDKLPLLTCHAHTHHVCIEVAISGIMPPHPGVVVYLGLGHWTILHFFRNLNRKNSQTHIKLKKDGIMSNNSC